MKIVEEAILITFTHSADCRNHIERARGCPECSRKRKSLSFSTQSGVLQKRLKTEDQPQPSTSNSDTNSDTNADTSSMNNTKEADESCVVSSSTDKENKTADCLSDDESSASCCSSSSSASYCSSSSSDTSSSSSSSSAPCSSSSSSSDCSSSTSSPSPDNPDDCSCTCFD